MKQKKKLRILIVDDNPADAGILRRNLQKIEHFDAEVTHCLDWESGKQEISQHEPDCVLLDYRLGEKSGLDVLSELRESGCDVPIIAISGRGDELVAVETLKRGAQDYLVKAVITPSSLQRAINNAVEKVALGRQIQDKQQELEDFASVVAHDLQQPLAAVKGHVELIRDFYQDNLDEKGRGFVEAAVKMANRMSRMIDALLAYSRVGRLGQAPKPVDLGALMESVLGGLTKLLEQNQGRVEVRSLPTVIGDEVALSQLLQNLVANAIKFRGPEPPVVEVGAHQEDGAWRVWVKDNGIGIDPQKQQEIFAPFTRLHSSKEYEGSGIGLATCKKIVDQHHGRIWVESEPGKGSTFYFTLPADQKADETTGNGAHHGKILIIDDEPEIISYLKEVLCRKGYDVFSATSSQEAAHVLSHESCDLVISDLVIPGEDKLAPVHTVLREAPNVTVIAVSGGGGKFLPGRLLGEAKTLGAARVFPKPVETGELLLAIDELVGKA